MDYIEKEIKYQISTKSYTILNEYLFREAFVLSEIIHENFYIDNDNCDIEKNDGSVRFRTKSNGVTEFTVKNKINNCQENLHVKKEYTKILEGDLVRSFYKGKIDFELIEIINRIFEFENPITFRIIGSMKTIRKRFLVKDVVFPKGFVLLLDKNLYLGMVDYEIEVEEESFEDISRSLRRIFNLLDIKPINDFRSKTSRFKEYYRKELSKS